MSKKLYCSIDLIKSNLRKRTQVLFFVLFFSLICCIGFSLFFFNSAFEQIHPGTDHKTVASTIKKALYIIAFQIILSVILIFLIIRTEKNRSKI